MKSISCLKLRSHVKVQQLVNKMAGGIKWKRWFKWKRCGAQPNSSYLFDLLQWPQTYGLY